MKKIQTLQKHIRIQTIKECFTEMGYIMYSPAFKNVKEFNKWLWSDEDHKYWVKGSEFEALKQRLIRKHK